MDTKTKKGEFEWIILFFVTGYIPMKAYAIYEINTKGTQPLYLYLSVGAMVLWLISAAKLDLFNIFRVVRAIPSNVVLGITYIINDYKCWKLTGKRLYKK